MKNQELTNSIENLKGSIEALENDGDWGIKGLTIKMESLSSDLVDLNRNLKNLCEVLSAIERKLK